MKAIIIQALALASMLGFAAVEGHIVPIKNVSIRSGEILYLVNKQRS